MIKIFEQRRQEKQETNNTQQTLEAQIHYLKSKDKDHADEIKRVRSETKKQTKAELQKKYKPMLEKAESNVKMLRSIIQTAKDAPIKGSRKNGPGKPKSSTEKVTISIRITVYQKEIIEKLKDAKILKHGELSQLVSDALQERFDLLSAKGRENSPIKSHNGSRANTETDAPEHGPVQLGIVFEES